MEYTREELTNEFSARFQTLLHTYDFCMQRTLNKYGLYPGQPQLLFALRMLDSPTQNELAKELSISKASVGVSLKRLEAAGFVKRVRDKKDTRCVRISLTSKGVEYAHWCEIDFEMIFTAMLENFSRDDRMGALNFLDSMNTGLDELKRRIEG